MMISLVIPLELDNFFHLHFISLSETNERLPLPTLLVDYFCVLEVIS